MVNRMSWIGLVLINCDWYWFDRAGIIHYDVVGGCVHSGTVAGAMVLNDSMDWMYRHWMFGA